MAVGKSDRRRPVPRLHEGRVVLVKSAFVLRHGMVILPCLGHHHHDRVLQRAARHQQELERIVERARIGTVGFDDRKQLV